MTSDSKRKIEQVAADLDDLATTVEELEIDTTVQSSEPELRRIKNALEEASDATDALDEDVDRKRKNSAG
jgi:outer membrane murein-binding lipoprotein Lpp